MCSYDYWYTYDKASKLLLSFDPKVKEFSLKIFSKNILKIKVKAHSSYCKIEQNFKGT